MEMKRQDEAAAGTVMSLPGKMGSIAQAAWCAGAWPTMKLAGEAAKVAERMGVKNIALSITHTAEQAFAQVIFET